MAVAGAGDVQCETGSVDVAQHQPHYVGTSWTDLLGYSVSATGPHEYTVSVADKHVGTYPNMVIALRESDRYRFALAAARGLPMPHLNSSESVTPLFYEMLGVIFPEDAQHALAT